jgi:hypothetical protein
VPQSKGCEVPLNTVLGSIPGPAIRQFSGTLRGKGRWGRLTLERQRPEGRSGKRPEGRSGKRPERRSGNGRSGGVLTITSLLGGEFGALVPCSPFGDAQVHVPFCHFFSLETVVLLLSPGLSSQVVRSNFLGGPPLCAFKL